MRHESRNIHFCLNHPRIAPDYITKQNDNCINTQKCTDWQLSWFDSSDAALHENIISNHSTLHMCSQKFRQPA